MSSTPSLKFTGTPGRRFGAELRQKVNAYFRDNKISEKGNWKMALKAIMMPGLYLAPFVIILTVSMPFWFMMILAVISGAGLAFTGMTVMHDAAHGSLSSRNWLNQLFANIMHVLGGSTTTWRVQHNVLHHTYTNIGGYDEDLEGPPFLRMSTSAPLRPIHRFQHWYALFFYSFLTLSKMVADIPQLLRYGRMGLMQKIGTATGKEVVKLLISKLLYLGVVITLPAIFTDFAWWQLLLGFLAMHMTAGFIMSTVFQLAHVVEETSQFPAPENQDMETEWAIHQLRTTADFSPRSPIVRWFTGGLNYQIEHHLFPNICHVHYRKIAPIVEETAKEFGLPYYRKPTIWAALSSHLRMLRNLGRKPAMA